MDNGKLRKPGRAFSIQVPLGTDTNSKARGLAPPSSYKYHPRFCLPENSFWLGLDASSWMIINFHVANLTFLPVILATFITDSVQRTETLYW